MTPTELLGSLTGQEIAGGCDSCDAVQTVAPHAEVTGVFHVTVHHEIGCRELAEHLRCNRAARRAAARRKGRSS